MVGELRITRIARDFQFLRATFTLGGKPAGTVNVTGHDLTFSRFRAEAAQQCGVWCRWNGSALVPLHRVRYLAIGEIRTYID